MGRFASSGRGGRVDSVPSGRPKYLSLPLPILKYRKPPLTPELTDYSSSEEEISFEHIVLDDESVSSTSIHSNDHDDNGWITPSNCYSHSRFNHLQPITVTSPPTTLQRLLPKYIKNKSSIWNTNKLSHNSVLGTNRNKFLPLDDMMSDAPALSDPPLAAPVTPPRERSRRKANASSPAATTSSKKLKGASLKEDEPRSPPSPKSNYIYLSATTSTKEIMAMTKPNLVNEVVKTQTPSDDILTIEMASALSMEALIEKATAARDTLGKTIKN